MMHTPSGPPSPSEAPDLAALVVGQDLDLGYLSEEELEALWSDRTLETAGFLRSEVFVALKSLLSSERAHLEDGELVLGGFLGLIREIIDSTDIEVGIKAADAPGLTWIPADGTVLERTWEPPGLLHFVLRSRPRALTELATRLLPLDGPVGPVTFAVHDLSSEDDEPVSAALLDGEAGNARWTLGADVGAGHEAVDRTALRRRIAQLLE